MSPETFPYGKAPFWILVMALISGALVFFHSWWQEREEYDLTLVTFAANHYEVYRHMIPEFEKEHGVRVQLQLVSQQALQNRLQSALLAGVQVPDLVEIVNPTMGYYTKGPLEDVGFVDLTDRLREEGLDERIVSSRFSLWSSRGRIFAIPHDVHPVALCYRRDLVEELGIDVDAIETWDDFVAMGREITADLTGNGIIDRYALDLPSAGGGILNLLLFQRDGGLFDEDGRLIMDSEINADTIDWYVRQTRGPDRISFPAGWGQTLARTMLDGLVVFFFCPDWRTKQFELDMPTMRGKLALMPLPAWEEGGRRTSTWGGTGLAITKASKNRELAWELAKFLYFDEEALGDYFARSNILPPFKDAWDRPEFHQPNEFYSGQPLGRIMVELAQEAPPEYVTAYTELAATRLEEAFLNAATYYERNGEAGLREFIREELRKAQSYVERVIRHNVFLKEDDV